MTAVAFVYLGGLQEGAQPLIKSGAGNLDWRIQGWSDLVGAWSHNVTDWAVGEPFGSGFTRKIQGIATNSHPHNFYIETMIRTGVTERLEMGREGRGGDNERRAGQAA